MSDSQNTRLESDRSTAVRSVISFVLVLGVLLLGIGIAIVMFKTGPEAEETAEGRPLPPVETMMLEIADFPVEITSQASIESRRETRLAAELSGRVIEVAEGFRRGGSVANGEVLVWLEATDFEAALAEARSALADAELALVQEEARSEQARVDWQRLGGNREANPLALREPQLASARARADAARAAVALAERNLTRTEIRAPFDASVREAMVEVGAVTRPGEPIAELFTASELEIRLPLTLEDYGFLKIRENGSVDAEITLIGSLGGRDVSWQATPVRLDAEIDRRTMSAFLIARVLPNPESGALELPPVGLFVDATISGDTLSNVALIPRRALREGGEVIVIDGESRVEFRQVDVARTTRELAVVRGGLQAGDRICLTRLNAPVAGMEVIDTIATQAPE
jgi:RND family efflux transporter MFP subunit